MRNQHIVVAQFSVLLLLLGFVPTLTLTAVVYPSYTLPIETIHRTHMFLRADVDVISVMFAGPYGVQRVADGFGPTLLSIGWLTVSSVFVVFFLLSAALGGNNLVRVRVKVRLRIICAGKFVDELSAYKTFSEHARDR